MRVTDIKIDGFSECFGIDRNVSASWKFEGEGENAFQKSYQLKVKEPDGTIYDTGRVEDACHQGINLPNIVFRSFEKYQIQVIVEDLAGNTAESEWLSFVTGAVNSEDFQGKWIGNGNSKPFYARKIYSISKKIESAYAAVCGFGQFVFYINGKKVGNHELDPGWTNYNLKAQYVMFDIAEYLSQGENAFGISVGNGFYLADKGERYFFEMPPAAMKKFMPPNTNGYEPFGTTLPLKAMMIIQYTDGSTDVIATDTTWKVKESACILANVYGSELYDARKYPVGWNAVAFEDEYWNYAKEVDGPKGRLCAQGQPPIITKKICTAKLVERQEEGYLYDFGQNMSCMLELSAKGKAGQKIELLVAEKLDANGKIDQMAKNWNMIDVSCTYILAGNPEGETWKQEFSYVGARYVLIKGGVPEQAEVSSTEIDMPQILSLKGHYIVSDSPITGTFQCDDERYNQVYRLIAEAMDSNLKSVHTDCPSIEKTAWLEESHLLAPSIMFYRDVRDLWSKIFDDAVIEQYTAETKENGIMGEPFYRGAGFLPPIAPAYGKLIVDTPMGNFWDLIVWSSFSILGAKWFYQYYGNSCMIKKYYETDCRYMDYLATRVTEDGFVAHGLGDWGNPQMGAQATANVETAFYYEDLLTMAEFAELLEKPMDKEKFIKQAEKVRENYNEKLLVRDESGKWCYKAWNHKDTIFCTQACQALPLYFGMVPEEKEKDVTETLTELLAPSGFVSGEVGFPAILRSLQKSGRRDLIWNLAMKEDAFSFYHFVQTGETALGEYWEDNPRSHNHDMMGSLMECYYTDIAGIKNQAPGFTKVLIKPCLPEGMNRMRCVYNCIQGELIVEVETGIKSRVSVTVPAGMEAELDLTALGLEVQKELVPGKYVF